MSEKQLCPICGEPTRVYMGKARKDRLCYKHADELKAGKIVMCEECGEWHSADESCKCNEYVELPSTGFDKCVICGTETIGYAFCRDCWGNYSKEELLEILNGKAVPKEEEKKKESVKIEENEAKEEILSKSPQVESPVLEQDCNKCIVINENNKSKCITC